MGERAGFCYWEGMCVFEGAGGGGAPPCRSKFWEIIILKVNSASYI